VLHDPARFLLAFAQGGLGQPPLGHVPHGKEQQRLGGQVDRIEAGGEHGDTVVAAAAQRLEAGVAALAGGGKVSEHRRLVIGDHQLVQRSVHQAFLRVAGDGSEGGVRLADEAVRAEDAEAIAGRLQDHLAAQDLLPEGFLNRFLLGVVFDLQQVLRGGRRRIADGGADQAHPDGVGIAVQAAQLQADVLAARVRQLLQQKAQRGPILRVDQRLQRPAGQLMGSIAEQRAQRRVGQSQATVRSQQGHADRRAQKGGLQGLSGAIGGPCVACCFHGYFRFRRYPATISLCPGDYYSGLLTLLKPGGCAGRRDGIPPTLMDFSCQSANLRNR